MLIGMCTRCNRRYIGWALARPEHQTCPECEAKLVVRNIAESYQPDNEIEVTARREGIAEWPGEPKGTTSHFRL